MHIGISIALGIDAFFLDTDRSKFREGRDDLQRVSIRPAGAAPTEYLDPAGRLMARVCCVYGTTDRFNYAHEKMNDGAGLTLAHPRRRRRRQGYAVM
jgi:hypothetical protein